MAVRKNPDGKTSTVTRTGVTGTAGDGRGTPINRNPRGVGVSRKSSLRNIPKKMTAIPRKQR